MPVPSKKPNPVLPLLLVIAGTHVGRFIHPALSFTVIVDRMFTKLNASSVLRLTLQLIIVDQESL